MKIQPFRAVYARLDQVASPDDFCKAAKDAYPANVAAGLYGQFTEQALFVYQIESAGRLHTGLIGINEADDFFSGKIKKHEQTLEHRESQHLTLFLEWKAILKPVLLTFPPAQALTGALEQYAATRTPDLLWHFEAENQVHRIWKITETATIQALQALLAREVQGTYIADGHHRTTTFVQLHEAWQEAYPEYDFSHLFCAYFAADQLDILDYNRVITGLEQLDEARFWAQLGQHFTIQDIAGPQKPEQKHCFTLFYKGKWRLLSLKPAALEALGEQDHVVLDVDILQDLVLEGVLGLQDDQLATQVQYIIGLSGFSGITDAVGSDPARMGFMLYPVDIDDMMRLADEGKTLPPKSTYFEPRMKTGVLVMSLVQEESF